METAGTGCIEGLFGLGDVGQLRAIRQVVADKDEYWLLGAEQAGLHIGLSVHASQIVFDNNSEFGG